MALDIKNLDPTGSGSKGLGTLATYDGGADTIITMTGAGYFNGAANEMGRVKAVMLIGTDGAQTGIRKVSVAAGVVTLAALD